MLKYRIPQIVTLTPILLSDYKERRFTAAGSVAGLHGIPFSFLNSVYTVTRNLNATKLENLLITLSCLAKKSAYENHILLFIFLS